MHEFNKDVEALAQEILAYSLERLRDNPPLDGPQTPEELYAKVGNTITEEGLCGHEALKVFTDTLALACISTDHPRYLSFIPSAPSEHSNLFDLVVGSSAVYGGSWLEGAGAVFAENQALRWISDLAGLPQSSGGVFVQGGTIGNLSALVAARMHNREKYPDVTRWVVACSSEAHSSIESAAEIMDVLVLNVPATEDGVMTGASFSQCVDTYLAEHPTHRVFAVIATAGTTNLGIIDDINGVGLAAIERDIWFHVDGGTLRPFCPPSI
jgi:glutamate/tyrosine decarboxylase-like PLP-dependent enzyme